MEKQAITRQTHTLDATEQAAGRLATQIATLLRGKHKPSFAPHEDCGDFVTVENAAKMKFTGKKLEQKEYIRHTGYPGGIRKKTLAKVMENAPEEALRHAVAGMLPKTRLRPHMLKRLTIRP